MKIAIYLHHVDGLDRTTEQISKKSHFDEFSVKLQSHPLSAHKLTSTDKKGGKSCVRDRFIFPTVVFKLTSVLKYLGNKTCRLPFNFQRTS
jgi:hypothetical protein